MDANGKLRCCKVAPMLMELSGHCFFRGESSSVFTVGCATRVREKLRREELQLHCRQRAR